MTAQRNLHWGREGDGGWGKLWRGFTKYHLIEVLMEKWDDELCHIFFNTVCMCVCVCMDALQKCGFKKLNEFENHP